ncbi:MAG TPA: glycosyltransferase [Gaiellaceae bacterium]|jgi:glycosyltransferase involved in cell wall biosynthesis|nr:glycosyltransferase [Gaiellaceae bacterium]
MSSDVTVVIPTLATSPYLREAVGSALAENPAEVIVVANGGAEVELDGVRILRREEADRSAARNLGVEEARTPLVAFLDDDDLALPGRLKRQRAALEEAWWAPLAFGRVRVVDGDGRPLDDWNRLLDRRFSRLARAGAASYEDVLAVQAPIYTSATMVRRDAFLAVGGFDSAFDAYEDLDLYLRLARIGDLLPLDGEPVTTYRLHGANTPSPRLYDGALRVAEKHLPRTTGRARRLLLERRVDALWGLERFAEARRAAVRGLLEEPTLLLHPRFARRLAGLVLR